MKTTTIILLSLLMVSALSAQVSNPTFYFSPAADQQPCVASGFAVNDTLYFTCPDSATMGGLNVTINSLTFDSINNLPAGLSWRTNQVNNVFPAGVTGYIIISGTQTAAQGQYKLHNIVTLNTNLVTLTQIDASPYLGMNYYLRVACSGGSCQPVDTTNNASVSFIPYTSGCSIQLLATVTPSGATTFCSGGSVTLSANFDSSYSYHWNTGSVNRSISVSASGSYQVTVYSGADSAVSNITTVTVNTCNTNNNPTFYFSPSADQQPCVGSGFFVNDTLFFTCPDTTTIQGITMSVNSITFDSINNLPAGLSWRTNQVNNVFPAGVTGYIIISGTQTAAQGQYKLRNIVTLNTSIVTLSQIDASLYLGLNYYLRVACSGGSCLPIDTANTASVSFIPYTQGCSLGLAATVTAGGPTTFCSGGSVTLSANFDSTYSYRWNTGSNNSAITVSTAGSYQVTVYSGSDSAVSNITTVTVNTCNTNNNPTFYFSPAADQQPCVGSGFFVNDTLFFTCPDTATLSGIGVIVNSLTFDSINNLPSGLSWRTNQVNNVFPAGVTGYIIISGTQTAAQGQYKLRNIVTLNTSIVTLSQIDASLYLGLHYYLRVACSGGNCQSIDTTNNASVSFIPYSSGCSWLSATITPSGSTTFCSGNSVTLTGNFGSAYTYRWNTGSTSRSIIVSTGGSYTVTVYDAIDSATASVSVVVEPNPTAAFTLQPDPTPHVWDVVNLCSGNTALTYVWSWGDSTSTTTTNPALSHTFDSAGYYTVCVSVTDSLGCASNLFCDTSVYLFKDQSGQMIQVNVIQYPLGIPVVSSSQHINFYAGALHFSEAVAAPAAVAIYDASGRRVMSEEHFTGNSLNIPQGVADGVYVVHIQSSEYIQSGKIVIVR